MADSFEDLVNRGAQVIMELREVIQEGHSLLKEFRKVNTEIDTKLKVIPAIVEDKIGNDIDAGLEDYKKTLREQVEVAKRRVDSQFNKTIELFDMLLAEDKASIKEGRIPIDVQLKAKAALRKNQW